MFPLIQSWEAEIETQYNYGITTRTDERTGRLVSMEAIVDLRHSIPDQTVPEEVKKHFQKSAEPGDVMMFYVDPKSGGPANETFNVVPMNPSVAEFWKKNVSETIYQALKKEATARICGFIVYPLYVDNNTTRPSGFIVMALVRRRPDDVPKANKYYLVVKGYIPNPPKAKSVSEVDEPTLYSSERWAIRHWERSADESFSSHIAQPLKGIESGDFERTELGNFVIYMKNGVIPVNCTAMNKKHTQFEKSARRDDDVPGLLLSQRLGGCQEDSYNVVPMSPRALKEYKTKVEDPVVDFLLTTIFTYKPPSSDGETPPRYVRVNMIVVYANDFATRPAGFFFQCTRGPLIVVESIYIPN
ncbi:hypothetical protein GE061_013894 [Apolygus lucorum]|uniref:Uncharacterized protein n=1 Tax=Apolygus lucorum TaxID=248454 RepID=A0A8S9XPB0_APOLU|nr:hypothetical protein GE061_013894 [Apolygus lucorum]